MAKIENNPTGQGEQTAPKKFRVVRRPQGKTPSISYAGSDADYLDQYSNDGADRHNRVENEAIAKTISGDFPE